MRGTEKVTQLQGVPIDVGSVREGGDRRLAAGARAAAKESKADQRVTYAAVALERRSGGAARVRPAGKESDELRSFSAPAATKLINSKHNEPALCRTE